MAASNLEFNDQYQKIQYYLRKNALDLSIDQVVEKLDGLGCTPSNTECRNYWSKRCEVTHRSVRVSINQDYRDWYFDNIRYADFYVCDKFWVVNFTQYKPTIKKLTKKEHEELQRRNLEELHARIRMSDKEKLAAEAEDRRRSLKAQEQERLQYLDSLSISISGKLNRVSRPLHADSSLLAEGIYAIKNRKKSLYDPELGFHVFEDNFHPPVRTW